MALAAADIPVCFRTRPSRLTNGLPAGIDGPGATLGEVGIAVQPSSGLPVRMRHSRYGMVAPATAASRPRARPLNGRGNNRKPSNDMAGPAGLSLEKAFGDGGEADWTCA